MKNFIFLILISLSINGYGQIFADSVTVSRELKYDKAAEHRALYVENLFDTLYFNGEKYFFGRTPLAIRKGYTNILPKTEKTVFIGPYPMHPKGYRISWLMKNDSLFIDKIYPFYFLWSETYDEDNPWPKDTLTAKFEAFTGCRFKNGLLFVDWIEGDFRIRKVNPDAPEKQSEALLRISDDDYLSPPLLINFKNGIFIGIKEDKKALKEINEMNRGLEKYQKERERLWRMSPEKASIKRDKKLEQLERRQERSMKKLKRKGLID